jgi:hypothetical protein
MMDLMNLWIERILTLEKSVCMKYPKPMGRDGSTVKSLLLISKFIDAAANRIL